MDFNELKATLVTSDFGFEAPRSYVDQGDHIHGLGIFEPDLENLTALIGDRWRVIRRYRTDSDGDRIWLRVDIVPTDKIVNLVSVGFKAGDESGAYPRVNMGKPMKVEVRESSGLLTTLTENPEWDSIGININFHPSGRAAEVNIDPSTMRLLLPLFIAFARTGKMMPGGLPEYWKLRRSYEAVMSSGEGAKIEDVIYSLDENQPAGVRKG